ncbi:hypothetical protein EDD17DRAFT_1850158 [Pisolithus thermaeus]|nr:hypothetical protein EDD17DRAFT_1850158 [Pisolithus thermaeus]
MLRLIIALLCLPFCLAAQKSPRDELVQLAATGNGVIRLDERTFDLLTSPNRDWSAAIQLTALNPQRRCGPCKEFGPSFQAVAKAWSTVNPEQRNNHFFASIDFDDAFQVFKKLGIMSAPVVHVYPATEGPNAKTTRNDPFKYDFSNGFEARPLAEQLSSHTPIPIPYKDPINWTRVTSLISLIPIVALVFRFIRPVLQNRWVWAANTILLSTIMTSGYMFTRIRGTPYVAPDGSWLAAGFQTQYGQEVQVVSLLCAWLRLLTLSSGRAHASSDGVLAGSFVLLILLVPQQSSPSRQRTADIHLDSDQFYHVLYPCFMFSDVKNRGYPFKLLF